MYVELKLVFFFAQVHSVTRLSTSRLAPHSHKFFAFRLLSQVSRSLSCAAGWDVCHGLFLFFRKVQPVWFRSLFPSFLFFFIYETSCQLRVEWARLLDTRTRPVWRSFSFCWHQKPLKWWWEKSSLPAASQNDQKGNTYRGPSDTQRRTDRRTLAHVFKENTVGQTTPEKVVRVWSLHLLLIKVSV